MELNVEYLLYVDMDMTFEREALLKLLRIIEKHHADIVQNGYMSKYGNKIEFVGFGFTLMNRRAINSVYFKCYLRRESKPPIFCESVAILNAYKNKLKTMRGIFVYSRHYLSRENYKETFPRAMTISERIMNSKIVKVILYELSLKLFGYNIEYIIQEKLGNLFSK